MSEDPKSSSTRSPIALHWQILIAMTLAVAVAVALKAAGDPLPGDLKGDALEAWLDTQPIGWVLAPADTVGQLFVKLLKMIIMPLILASVVMSIATLDGGINRLRRLGIKTVVFYATTTLFAVVVGIVIVNLATPGAGMDLTAAQPPGQESLSIQDLILSMVPDNVFAALSSNSAILSVIVFAIIFGIALVVLGDRAAPVTRFFEALNDTMMLITDWLMRLAPIGVFALLLSVLARVGMEIVVPLSSYMATVVGGLLFHALVTLPVIYWVITRRNPLDYIRALSTPLMTAFSTASSAATMPLTMEHAEKRGGVHPSVGGFVIPLGATANMDGTALYEAVAAIFIAQAFGVDLTLGEQILIVVTATLAAIGAAGVPSAGLITMLIVLESVGLPEEGYGLIIAVDRILDMCRTTVNVWGDAVGAAVLASTEDMLEPVDLDALD